MRIAPRETVILAEDFEKLVNWYSEILGFKTDALFTDRYHYANMSTESGIKIGIALAKEIGVELKERAQNSVILQIEVDDVAEFYEYLKEKNGTIIFGPSLDGSGDFYCGAIADAEGNQIWVVDKNCP